jgi:predicted nucleotidyltransferase
MKSYIIKKTSSFFKDRPEVIAVYLFGSFARGKHQKDSDVDLAVLLDHEEVHRRDHLMREYTVSLARVLRKDLHIVIMNNAGELLTAQILKNGQCIVNRKPELLSRFKMVSYAMIAEFADHRNRMEKRYVRRLLGESL